jgi:hypothetical protein
MGAFFRPCDRAGLDQLGRGGGGGFTIVRDRLQQTLAGKGKLPCKNYQNVGKNTQKPTIYCSRNAIRALKS